MRKVLTIAAAAAMMLAVPGAAAQEFNRIPVQWKWTGAQEAAFTYDGSFTDSTAFSLNARTHKITSGIKAPAKFTDFPVKPEGAVNLTFSPDSSKLAFTRANNLFIVDIESGEERQLTFDGTDLILNGYASWVYYEEIFGRPSRYRAFWWSPDSRKIAYYRFDDSEVPMFPIYSPFGQDGKLRETHYPKAGEKNPEVRIGFIDVSAAYSAEEWTPETVWADFDPSEDQYFGTPFWGRDGRELFISRMPRIQNTLDLYSVSPADGSKKHIYHETYPTWLDWIDGMKFTEKGLYMARSFETGWQQIYFLSYDGKEFRRLTSGPNWRISIIKVDEINGDVYFTAQRDSHVRQALYKVTQKGVITALTDINMNVDRVSFSPDGRYFVASVSNMSTPTKVVLCDTRIARNVYEVADLQGPDFYYGNYSLPQIVYITVGDGLEIPASIVYPKDFDMSGKYPVHVDIYGGPDTPLVTDTWSSPERYRWWAENGIIEVTADCRAAGHNGRAGLDAVYKHLNTIEVSDFVSWADYLKSLPYVDGDKIGVEGFSFGGTMTTMLLLTASDSYHYGIAGGGVYDWKLYDSHYTERFMSTPDDNPEGYASSRVMGHVGGYPAQSGSLSDDVLLKITHGTGDDNVHFQNTLQLIDELQKQGKKFELMIYPDGMHGYGGYQGRHSSAANREFWLRHLKR